MDCVSLVVGMDRLAVNFVARFANHFDEEIAVLDQMFVAKTMRNQFGVLDRVLVRRKFESHSVSDRYPIPHVKIVSRHDSLINREFGAADALKA
jgi:hypothetical protein